MFLPISVFLQSKRARALLIADFFCACEKHDSLAGEVLSKYDALEYVDSDDFRLKHTVNEMFTQLLMEKGFQKKE